MKLKHTIIALAAPFLMKAQQVMTPEILWTLNKFSVTAVEPSHAGIIYSVGKIDLNTEKTNRQNFYLNFEKNQILKMDLLGKKSIFQWDKNGVYATEGDKIYISKDNGLSWAEFYTIGDADNIVISPDGKKVAFSKAVQVEKLLGKDKYADLPKTTAQIYTDLNHRHWDAWNEGKYNHVFVANVSEDVAKAQDVLQGQKFDSPQKPSGGSEDFIWSPDSSKLLYVCKKKSGKEYATSTNTDIYAFDLASGKTENLTEGMMGYDVNPKFSPDGKSLLWQSMARDGYEADKNDVVVMDWVSKKKTNLTKNWDESVVGDVAWSNDSKMIYFTTAKRGTKQFFVLNSKDAKVKQISDGAFDVNEIIALENDFAYVTRTDINHSADLFKLNLKDGMMLQVTSVNKENYANITPGKSELKMVNTTDEKEMGVWFHYPPNFDPNKQYPTHLYFQGTP